MAFDLFFRVNFPDFPSHPVRRVWRLGLYSFNLQAWRKGRSELVGSPLDRPRFLFNSILEFSPSIPFNTLPFAVDISGGRLFYFLPGGQIVLALGRSDQEEEGS